MWVALAVGVQCMVCCCIVAQRSRAKRSKRMETLFLYALFSSSFRPAYSFFLSFLFTVYIGGALQAVSQQQSGG